MRLDEMGQIRKEDRNNLRAQIPQILILSSCQDIHPRDCQR